MNSSDERPSNHSHQPKASDTPATPHHDMVGAPLPIVDGIAIPAGELHWHFDDPRGIRHREGATSASRVDLVFLPGSSKAIDLEHRQIVMEHLEHKLTKHGELHIIVDEESSQHANRCIALDRLQDTLRQALQAPTPRTPTAIPGSERAHRIEDKHWVAAKKADRHAITDDSD